MTVTEVKYLIGFLEDLSDHYGNAGSNDMRLPDTPENREMVKQATLEATGGEEEELNIQKGKICTCDFYIVGYLQSKLKKEYGLTSKDIPSVS